MPFELCNAPASFQRLMEALLHRLTWKLCLVYIDDELIFSKTFDEHLQHIATVLERFGKANIKLKPSTCYFAQTTVKYLGHLVSEDGVRPDPDKIAAVNEFPVPKHVKGVRSFIGLANY